MSPVGYPDRALWLGPCPCRRCGVRVWWTGWRWVEKSGRKHACVTP